MKTGSSETFANRIVWHSCYNNSGQTIPPFSVVMATDWNLPDMSGFQTDSPYLDVIQPDGNGMPWNHYITWEVEICAECVRLLRGPIKRPSSLFWPAATLTPPMAPWRLCGPQPGQWTLTRDCAGLRNARPAAEWLCARDA